MIEAKKHKSIVVLELPLMDETKEPKGTETRKNKAVGTINKTIYAVLSPYSASIFIKYIEQRNDLATMYRCLDIKTNLNHNDSDKD